MKMGKLIAVEGFDGVGKGTAIKFIEEKLTELNVPHISTRIPGGCVVGEMCRDIVLNHKTSNETALMLMQSSRIETWKNIMWPALKAGKWVICDRFTASSYAYQVDTADMLVFAEKVIESTTPAYMIDQTIYITCDFDIACERIEARNAAKDVIESKPFDELERIYDRYNSHSLQSRYANWKTITNNRTEEHLKEKIVKFITEYVDWNKNG